MSGSPTSAFSAKSNGAKRTLDGQVKREPDAEQPQPLQPQQQPQASMVGRANAWDYHKTSACADKICTAIRDFESIFLLSGDNIPVVLHFPLKEWTTALKNTLLDLGLEEHAAMCQIHTSLCISLARWAKNVAMSNTAKSLCLKERWLVEPLVRDCVRLGYFEDEHKSLEKIVLTASNLHVAGQ
jgi:hypothetical protein